MYFLLSVQTCIYQSLIQGLVLHRKGQLVLRASQYSALHSSVAKTEEKKKGIDDGISVIYKSMNISIKATQTTHFRAIKQPEVTQA